MAITTLAELVEEASSRGVSIGAIVREREAEQSGRPEDDLDADMRERLGVMRSAVDRGLAGVRSRSGLTGGDGPRMASARMNGETICGEPFDSALAYALAVAEVNASMGRIVAAPTAGSCGVLPGVLLSVGERLCVDDLALVEALFAAGGVGAVIERSSTLSGAAAGCQAECGSAAAMASAAAVQLAGGSPEACASAVAIAFKGLLGLVCDPVAGLVEVPCIKRNATSVAVALAAADMALAGIRSVIPADEVIEAMGSIGRALPPSLRETALGGLAVTPTGKKVASGISVLGHGNCGLDV
ncbi:MAG: L-serine ammonia-lyase, iron-sulfur-dependent, subunit alpha [Bacillota bacterium]|nr:L-serine ammonia-lyase, iron-sulfur-dependent, subunit alpha [Bacillota bacterium]HOO30063.1 L-serine ammonia-lyase, iron-sulfur-dependent, subunit alpha [Bacillota bacterium]HPZ12862.1 L-serine ammonia-lyase, iron-sulfur-dependent, subunit alpha [Bacillota bacterium]